MNREPQTDNREFSPRGFNDRAGYGGRGGFGGFGNRMERSRSPRPYGNRDGYSRGFGNSQHMGNRYQGRGYPGYRDNRDHRDHSNNYSEGHNEFRTPRAEASSNDMYKKKRTEFPEQMIYEFRFFASPPKFQNFENVVKLADPNSDKTEVEEFLSILSNN